MLGCFFEILIALDCLSTTKDMSLLIVTLTTVWFALMGIVWNSSDWLNTIFKMVLIGASMFGIINLLSIM